MPMALSATQIVFLADFEGATNSSGGVCISHAVYTMSASTASLASSGSRYISWTSGSLTTTASQYGGASGTRYRTIPLNYSLTPGDYLFAWWVSTVNNVTCALFGRPAASVVGGFDGFETSYFMHGTSISTIAAFANSVVATNTNYVRTGAPPLRQPGAIFLGTAA
jgi:hypothetical protein